MGALVESDALTDEPPAVGSRFRDVFEDLGQRVELEAELVELDVPHALSVRLTSDLLRATTAQRLEETDAGTRLTTVVETTYAKLAARLLASVVARHAQKQLEADLARLKGLLEGRSPSVHA